LAVRGYAISAVGHVAIQVRDIDAAVEHATSVMGLRVSERSEDRVDLTHGSTHHSLQYFRSDVDAFDHVGLVANGEDALAAIRGRLAERGIPLLSDRPLDEVIEHGFSFEMQGGFVFEIYMGMPSDQPFYVPTGIRPIKFGHVNFGLEDPESFLDVLLNVLDFRISDQFRGGAFTRCNVEHHGIGVLRGAGVLAHHAWEVESIADLGHLGDLMDGRGASLLAGPIRHGIGNNIAAYMEGPGGILIEYYTDMLRIYDESTYMPGTWDEEGVKWFTRWAPQLPGPEVRQLALKPAPTLALGRVGR
jgi:catechol 2,3-dioxygenase-like lactoylglutathione lyase family enzyme